MSLTIETLPVPLRVDEHGVARVGGTRVTLASVLAVYKREGTAPDVVSAFPSLQLADVYWVLAYYHNHRDEVEQYLAEQSALAEATRAEIEKAFPPDWIRERIAAKRAEKGL
jgi:uncharacterized protein (DUF433 family)